MLGMDSTGGSVWPFSQFSTVHGLTPMPSPACVCVSLSSSRRFLKCSPRVLGSKSVSFGFSALSRIGTNCKRATRPCKCGYLGHYSGRCHCTADQVQHYRSRISGPLLDRIDLHVEVPAVPERDLFSAPPGESSACIRARVVSARELQVQRQGAANSCLSMREMERFAPLDADALQLLRDAVSRLNLSARASHRVIRVARTVADLDKSSAVSAEHIAEAICYRPTVRDIR